MKKNQFYSILAGALLFIFSACAVDGANSSSNSMSSKSDIPGESLRGDWDWSQVTNLTDTIILVYNNAKDGDPELLYKLGPGKTTKDGWDCDGYYIPVDRSFIDFTGDVSSGPLAVKIPGTLHAYVSRYGGNPNYYTSGAVWSGFNPPNWPVPRMTEMEVNVVTLPSAPTN